jgi:hypothetical protein
LTNNYLIGLNELRKCAPSSLESRLMKDLKESFEQILQWTNHTVEMIPSESKEFMENLKESLILISSCFCKIYPKVTQEDLIKFNF